MDKNKTKEVKPKVTPRMCGIVFVIPKLNPEYDATTLLGPGVYAVTNQNNAIDNISGCITKLSEDHFRIFVRDVLELLYHLYQLILKLKLEKLLPQYFSRENYKHL